MARLQNSYMEITRKLCVSLGIPAPTAGEQAHVCGALPLAIFGGNAIRAVFKPWPIRILLRALDLLTELLLLSLGWRRRDLRRKCGRRHRRCRRRRERQTPTPITALEREAPIINLPKSAMSEFFARPPCILDACGRLRECAGAREHLVSLLLPVQRTPPPSLPCAFGLLTRTRSVELAQAAPVRALALGQLRDRACARDPSGISSPAGAACARRCFRSAD